MTNNQSFDVREGTIWMNGNFIDWQDAKIHVLNHGLHYASCVFEGIRVYNGIAFKLKEHHERLHRSANIIGLSLPFSAEELNVATQNLISKNKINFGYIRTFSWRGSEMMQVAAPNSSINIAIAAWETERNFFNMSTSKEKGSRLQISKWARPAPHTAPIQSKCSANYAISTMSKHDALSNGKDDALLLDYKGFIAEASAANIFFFANNCIITPTTCCALSGITRQLVIEITKNENIIVVERDILPEELANMSEAFMTGTACEILPITSIDDYQFYPGKYTSFLIKKYSQITLGKE